MKYFRDLVNDNGDKLIRYNEAQVNREHMSVFEYSILHGGAYDSHKYYNDYVVELSWSVKI